jgi:hypothetical protein
MKDSIRLKFDPTLRSWLTDRIEPRKWSMREHAYQACTASINRHAGFVQIYKFKSVSKADALKFGTHPDQATRTAAIENVDRQVTTEAVWKRQIYVTMPCQHVRKRFA